MWCTPCLGIISCILAGHDLYPCLLVATTEGVVGNSWTPVFRYERTYMVSSGRLVWGKIYFVVMLMTKCEKKRQTCPAVTEKINTDRFFFFCFLQHAVPNFGVFPINPNPGYFFAGECVSDFIGFIRKRGTPNIRQGSKEMWRTCFALVSFRLICQYISQNGASYRSLHLCAHNPVESNQISFYCAQ